LILFAASLLVSSAIGILLTFLLRPSLKGGAAALLVLRLVAGSGLGLGLTSCLYFICLSLGLSRFVPALDLLLCLLLGIAAYVLFRRNAPAADAPSPAPGKPSLLKITLAGVFGLELIASVVSFVFAFLKEPHGRWDAWFIWNMHARFIYRGGDHWRDAFASGLDWSQWDYPLLLPLSVVRSWNYMGGEEGLVPALLALVFTLLTIGLLVAALASLKGWVPGYLAAMVLMGTPFFVFMGASQFADIPFSFFMLTTLVMLLTGVREGEDHSAGPLILAGIAAGLCAWTKNEGLLFLAIAAGCLFLAGLAGGGLRIALRRIGPFLAGSLPILLIILYFRTSLAPASYLTASFTLPALAEKLFAWERYAETARAFFIMGLSFTQGLVDISKGMTIHPGSVSILLLIGYLVLAGVQIEQRDRTGIGQAAAILALMAAGYFFIYVVTPLNLSYHLATSLNRLFLQLWPGVIFLFFMAAATPGEGQAKGAGPEVLPQPTKSRPLPGKKDRNAKEGK